MLPLFKKRFLRLQRISAHIGIFNLCRIVWHIKGFRFVYLFRAEFLGVLFCQFAAQEREHFFDSLPVLLDPDN